MVGGKDPLDTLTFRRGTRRRSAWSTITISMTAKRHDIDMETGCPPRDLEKKKKKKDEP